MLTKKICLNLDICSCSNIIISCYVVSCFFLLVLVTSEKTIDQHLTVSLHAYYSSTRSIIFKFNAIMSSFIPTKGKRNIKAKGIS